MNDFIDLSAQIIYLSMSNGSSLNAINCYEIFGARKNLNINLYLNNKVWPALLQTFLIVECLRSCTYFCFNLCQISISFFANTYLDI